MTQKSFGIISVAPTATRFVTKKVFKNQGVNQGSNFPGPTPKTKVAPNPIFREIVFDIFFEKYVPKNIFRENMFEKYFSKKPFSSKMIFLSPGTVKISIASKN